MANYCTNCGAELIQGAKFCTRCGAQFTEQPIAPQAQAPPVTQAPPVAQPVATPPPQIVQ